MSNKQCSHCKGYGLIKLKTPETCNNCLGERCYLCDRSNPYKTYEECKKCFGTGKTKENIKH